MRVGRDLSVHRGHSEQGDKEHTQMASEDLQDGNPTASLSNICQCSVSHTAQKCFLVFRGNYLCSSLCLLPLVLALGTIEKSLAPSSWHPPFRYL